MAIENGPEGGDYGSEDEQAESLHEHLIATAAAGIPQWVSNAENVEQSKRDLAQRPRVPGPGSSSFRKDTKDLIAKAVEREMGKTETEVDAEGNQAPV